MSKITKQTNVLQFIGLGWYVAGSILLGAFVGFWIDQKINSINFPVIWITRFIIRNDNILLWYICYGFEVFKRRKI